MSDLTDYTRSLLLESFGMTALDDQTHMEALLSQRAATIADLHERIAARDKSLDASGRLFSRACDEIATLRAEIARLEKDAGRWGYVREYRAAGYKIAYIDGSDTQVVLWADKADRAIDAAIAQTGEVPK